jgi:hypothetical protein
MNREIDTSWDCESRLDRQSRMHSDGWSVLTDHDDDEPVVKRSSRRSRGRGVFGLGSVLVLAVAAGGLMLILVRYLKLI